VFLPEVADVDAGGFEDPQPEQAQHHHQREIAIVGGLPGGGEHRLELQMGQPQRGRVGRHSRAAHVLGRRARQPAVDHAGAVETRQHRDPPRHRGRLEPARLLHPSDVPLQVRALRGQRLHAMLTAPGHEHTQVGSGVPGRSLEPTKMGIDRHPLRPVKPPDLSPVLHCHHPPQDQAGGPFSAVDRGSVFTRRRH